MAGPGGREEIAELLASGRFHTLIGDPMLGDLLLGSGIRMIPFPHPALSSKLYWNRVPRFLSEEMTSLLEDTVKES